MDWIEEFARDPDRLAVLGYGASALAVSAYAAYKNDFGAVDRTTKELEDYLEEVETGITNPLQTWKAREYRSELEERREDISGIGQETYEETLDIQTQLFYDEAREPLPADD